MKDKKVLIGVIAAAVILLIAGSVMLFSGKNKPQVVEETTEEEQTVQALKPEDVGLTLTPRSDNQAIKFTLGKAKDVKTIEFDAVYKHRDNPGENIYDQLELSGEKSTYESKYYELGTCSSGVCRYHADVESVKFIFKITKTNDTIYQVEQSITLE